MEKLLEKGAIEPVPFVEQHQGFYSTMFLVPKKTGDLRPVINLRPLNQYLKTEHFKMDTMSKVINLVKKGDWAISIDLRDAYFHIPIFPAHRRYLRFCVQGRAYQYRALAFGPKTSPRVFTKVVSVVAAHLRMQSIRLAVYLDDWLALNAIRRLLLQDRQKILNLLSQLGFLVNAEKSQLVPTQDITYIGGRFLLAKGIVLPTLDRLSKVRDSVLQIKDQSGTARQYLQMLGLMASCIEVVPYARLHMRPMQLHLLYWWKPVSGDLEMQIPGSQHIAGHLNWWLQEANMLKGRSFLQKSVSKTLSTDASLQGWGGTLGHQIVQGLWPPEKQAWHINCLELEAVLLTIKRFLPQLANQSVLIRSDNTTAVQYITRQGGTKSTQLCYKAWELWQLAIDNNIELKAAHIAGRLNVLPDQLSRVVIRPTEWTLNDTILSKIFQIWGKPMIDLFASFQNKKMDLFCSWEHHQAAYAVDAFSITWNRMFAYAFPPLCLVPKVLEHMKQGQCQIVLIAPQWPRRHWYPDLLQLCVANPIRLPTIQQMLSQPGTVIYHPNPRVFSLNAWLLSTDSCQQKAFLKGLETCYQPHGELALKRTIHVNSNSSIVGVVKDKLICIQHL